MSLDEAIRQEIKQNDATVVSGRENLVHKRHGAKKEEETNEEKNQEKKKKNRRKKWKTSTLPRSSTSVCEQQSSKNRRRKPRDNKWEVRQTRRRTPTLSPPALSLSSLRGSRRKEKEDSAKRFPYRNGYENAMLQTVMCGIRHRISRRNGQNALNITQPPVLPSYSIIPFHKQFFVIFQKPLLM